ncbi:MAG TPA: hypothetical protein VHV10_10355, partial [Ktedonobacteraceae bacterium]|nr:hypothetical protein [Ktedonobacteraceae bacterium]
MKEPFSGYLAKLVGKKEDCVTHLSPERAPTPKKISNDSSERHGRTQQAKGCDRTSNRAGKTKKYHMPFVALAFVLLFALPCFISLIGLRPVAFADKLTRLDVSQTANSSPTPNNSPTVAPGSPGSAPPDQTVSVLRSMGDIELGYGDKCYQFHTVTGDKFCWDKNDFWWGARDMTCVYNPLVPNRPNSIIHFQIRFFDDVQYQIPAVNVTLPTATLNQNTCTDNSTCVSDNASGHDGDDPKTPIHAQVGGDDIVCGNGACANDNTGTTTECGDPTGKQLAYDRFGCQMVNDSFSVNADHSILPTITASMKGIAINPTAYDPAGAIYLPTTFLTVADIEATSTKQWPTCAQNHRWSCPDDNGTTPSVVVYTYRGDFDWENEQYQVTTRTENVPMFYVVCDTINGGWA